MVKRDPNQPYRYFIVPYYANLSGVVPLDTGPRTHAWKLCYKIVATYHPSGTIKDLQKGIRTYAGAVKALARYWRDHETG